MWYAIKINCIYINEQVASIFSCNLRSDSELEQHLGPAFSVTPARRALFLTARNFQPAARNFQPAARNFQPVAWNFVPAHCYVPAQNFYLSTWVSAMPPVDNYISIFYWKTVTGPRYYNGRGIRPNVEMNCNDIFMRHIFWSTWNVKVIAQSPAVTAPQREDMADCWGPMLRKNSLSWPFNRLQLCLYQQAGGTRSKYNYWRRKGLTEQ